MDVILGIFLGIGLAAAVGLRVFVPLLLVAAAANLGRAELAPEFAWLASPPALVMLAVATVAEVLAYHVPWLDNLLDAAAGPAAAICGTVLVAATVVELSPVIRWPVAIIAGGGVAGLVHTGTAGARAGSTVTTAGVGNPLFASLETVASGLLTVVALVAPILIAVLVLPLVWLAWRWRRRRSHPA